jgi:hypothetical protein
MCRRRSLRTPGQHVRSVPYTTPISTEYIDSYRKLDEPTVREVTAISRNMLFLCAVRSVFLFFFQIRKEVTCSSTVRDYRKSDSPL